MAHVPGPDFPTGGILVEDPAAIAAAYEIGRGGFRLRAAWVREELKHGTWQLVVTEIPYQVQKSRLIEQIAELLEAKKLPLLADIRDESTELVRVVLEPRSRTVDPAMLMETLFRATQLETRYPLNMNVLDATRTPIVMGLRDVLRAWLDHRHEVLVRRSHYRLAAILRRLEVLDGYLAVFLNLDEVIRIIREEDEPKPVLMRVFKLSDVQAEAILNMRLRSLRRLEEMELRREHDTLSQERSAVRGLLDDERVRWKTIAGDIRKTRKAFGDGPLGKRRTLIGAPSTVVVVTEDAVTEREPITVVLSQKGWMRALRGHVADLGDLKFKDGDSLRVVLPCETVDRLCLFATNGRAYTLRAGDLPRGRGDGQPVRLLAEMAQQDEVVALFVWRAERNYLVAGAGGRGFVVASEDLVAEKRTGKTVLNLREGEAASLCISADGDHVALIGDNRRLLVFALDQIPRMARGLGVALQKYREGGLRDARVFRLSDGLTWRLGDRIRTETALTDWLGARGQTGRLPPSGFPKSGKFS
jgi:topoisomerase-4 subunit A